MGRNGEDGQGQAYGVPKRVKGVRLELGTGKSDRNKARVFGNGNGMGEVKVGVPVQGCRECNNCPHPHKTQKLYLSYPSSINLD